MDPELYAKIAQLAYERWKECRYRRGLYDWQQVLSDAWDAHRPGPEETLTDEQVIPFAEARWLARKDHDAAADWSWAEAKLIEGAPEPIKPYYGDYW
jgi:hypothetical protein